MSLDVLDQRAYAVGMVCEDGVKKSGLVVTRTDAVTAGKVTLVDADKEAPFGVTTKDTEDPLYPSPASVQYKTNVKQAMQRTGKSELVLANDNAEINVGDSLMAVKDGDNNEGVVDKLSIRTDSAANYNTDLLALVGWAQEYKAALAGATYGTKIKVLLDIRSG